MLLIIYWIRLLYCIISQVRQNTRDRSVWGFTMATMLVFYLVHNIFVVLYSCHRHDVFRRMVAFSEILEIHACSNPLPCHDKVRHTSKSGPGSDPDSKKTRTTRKPGLGLEKKCKQFYYNQTSTGKSRLIYKFYFVIGEYKFYFVTLDKAS